MQYLYKAIFMIFTIYLGLAFAGESIISIPSEDIALEEHKLDDITQEKRANFLFKNIKCVVCNGQAISESAAQIAIQMRMLVRDKIKAGESDSQIMDYLVARYSEEILFSPPVNIYTYALWILPFALLGLGVTWLVVKKLKHQ